MVVKKVKFDKRETVEDWEVDNALSTLVRADEIKSNKKLMKRIKLAAKKQEKVLKKVISNSKKKQSSKK
jgi:hypothetical protein